MGAGEYYLFIRLPPFVCQIQYPKINNTDYFPSK